MANLFHQSIAVHNIDETIEFYCNILGCEIGRKAANWVDINFFGHQLTAQLSPKNVVPTDTAWQGKRLFPVRHFGIVLIEKEWEKLKLRIEQTKTDWLIKPTTYYQAEVNEQKSFFVKDPSGYALEFKTFGINYDKVFTKN